MTGTGLVAKIPQRKPAQGEKRQRDASLIGLVLVLRGLRAIVQVCGQVGRSVQLDE